MKKPVLPIIAVAALVFAIVSIVRSQPKIEPTQPPSPPPRSEFPRTIAAVGLVEASTENISIGTPLSGVVERVFVAVGQTVKEKDPLFKLDDRHLQAERAARETAILSFRSKVKVSEAQLTDVTDQLKFAESLADKRAMSAEETARRRAAVNISQARLEEARADLSNAKAQLKVIETEIERSTVCSPISGDVLQVKLRPGEFATAGPLANPMIVLGQLQPLHVRVDVDEQEGWRVQPKAQAMAHVRGNAALKARLTFVRFEPFVVPKRSLTGDSTERVDTRVLQVIYKVEGSDLPLFVGQQMDVFIEDTAAGNTAEVTQNNDGRSN